MIGPMRDRYIPPSAFLQAVINEDVPFGADDPEDQNLARLIAMTADPDRANRDWAALLLSQLELDRPDVRQALSRAAADEDADVRAEAILGMAQLCPAAALPFLQQELRGARVSMPLLEAAILAASPSLVSDLEDFAAPSDDARLDQLVAAAITACRAAR